MRGVTLTVVGNDLSSQRFGVNCRGDVRLASLADLCLAWILLLALPRCIFSKKVSSCFSFSNYNFIHCLPLLLWSIQLETRYDSTRVSAWIARWNYVFVTTIAHRLSTEFLLLGRGDHLGKIIRREEGKTRRRRSFLAVHDLLFETVWVPFLQKILH